MRDQIKLLGILNIIWGGLSVLAAIIVFIALAGVAAVVSTDATDADAAHAGPLMALIGTIVSIFLVAIGLPAIIGGWGLLKLKPWSRIFMIVISALHLLSFPFGTALGVFGLVVLLKEQARVLLESGGQSLPYAPPGPPQSMMPPPPPPAAY